MRLLYLAGPMQGYPQFNFPLFHAVARELRAHGYHVFSPAEQDIERHGGVDFSVHNIKGDVAQSAKEHAFSLRDALTDDTHFICQGSEGIVFLPGWEHSNGALAEFFLARAIAKDPTNFKPYKFIYVHQLGENSYVIPGIGVVRT